MQYTNTYSEIYHHGVKGQKWGVRNYQNPDGSLTPLGRQHYGYGTGRKNNTLNSITNWTGPSSDFIKYTLDGSFEKDLKKDGIILSAAQQKAVRSNNEKVINVLDKMQKGQDLTAADKKAIGEPLKLDSPSTSCTNELYLKAKKRLDAQYDTANGDQNLDGYLYKKAKDNKELVANTINNLEWSTFNERANTMDMYSPLTANIGVENGTFKTNKEANIYLENINRNCRGITRNCPMCTLATELNARGIKASAGNMTEGDIYNTSGLIDSDIRPIFGYKRNAFNAYTTKHGTEKKPYIGVDPDNKDIIRLGSERMYSYDMSKSPANDKKFRKNLVNFCNDTGVPNARFGVLVKGHIFNARTDANGKMEFLDGQVGNKYSDPEEFFTHEANWFCGMTLFRTDNKNLDVDMLKEFNKPKYGVNGPYFKLG